MSAANKKTPRKFQCRNGLWTTFEDMAGELECSVDYLINDAMKQYARQRGYTNEHSQAGHAAPPASSPTAGAAPPPAPAPGAPHVSAPHASAPHPTAPHRAAPMTSRGPAPAPPPLPAAKAAAPAPYAPPTAAQAAPPAAQAPPAPAPPAPAPPGPPPSPSGASGNMTVPLSPNRLPPMPSAAAKAPARPAPPPPLPAGTSAPHPHAAPLPAPGAGMQSSPPPSLTIHYQGRPHQVTKDRFIIGRGKTSSDLTIRDPNVSRQHALVEFSGGNFYMVDMGSTNGVEFNGQRVQRKAIQNGDVYRVCEHELFCSMS